MESSVYKNVISTPLRCLIAGRRPGTQLAVNRDRRSRPPAAGSGAERHLAPPGVAEACALHRSTVSLPVRPVANHRQKHSSSGAVPLGTRKLGFSLNYSRKLRPQKLHFACLLSYSRLVETGGRRHPRRRAATFATLTRAAAGVSRETAPSLPLLRPRSPSARLGKSFPINSSFIGLISS